MIESIDHTESVPKEEEEKEEEEGETHEPLLF